MANVDSEGNSLTWTVRELWFVSGCKETDQHGNWVEVTRRGRTMVVSKYSEEAQTRGDIEVTVNSELHAQAERTKMMMFRREGFRLLRRTG